MTLDYRELLKKYIDHIAEEEGTAFLDHDTFNRFSDEEWAELRLLDIEGTEDE